jgi:hypothetical protein
VTLRPGKLALGLLTGLLLAGLTTWGALVLYFLAPGPTTVRTALAAALGLAGILTGVGLFLQHLRRWAIVGYGLALLPVLAVWNSAEPRNDRDWQTDVAVLPYATFYGDRVTVHNIRNFDYRTETDYIPAYYDRTFDIQHLDRVDLLAAYWMGPEVAHLFLTFGFGDDHLAISIEARKDKTRPYATLPGFFRQYELVYIVGDERDVIRLRTNYRADPPEELYLYPLKIPIENGRRIFREYLQGMNELHDHPRFYNTLTTNCTTMILDHAMVNPDHVPYSWKVLLSGYGPEYLYDLGRLDRTLPFAELRDRAHINAAARAADQSSEFSRLIRE